MRARRSSSATRPWRRPSRTHAGLGSTLYELNRAARSLRELADYLDRHPEALVRGRGDAG